MPGIELRLQVRSNTPAITIKHFIPSSSLLPFLPHKSFRHFIFQTTFFLPSFHPSPQSSSPSNKSLYDQHIHAQYPQSINNKPTHSLSYLSIPTAITPSSSILPNPIQSSSIQPYSTHPQTVHHHSFPSPSYSTLTHNSHPPSIHPLLARPPYKYTYIYLKQSVCQSFFIFKF